ncbi:glutamate--tRNA ligase [Acidisphaera sp. S103]|uniref:glutamate--tRNA ligase n=1 Tax=Acidisphaera sp. S103 TaxID=1747223 RepID=UPI00131CCD90|nr:glutamate--tRNA ligase family protein [Acidisphaera sp. S103]
MTRVRFAPTPTGNLFLSGARVALANHLFARHTNGQMLLRLDDLDPERARPAHADQIMQDLRWFGIDWQTSFRQSERQDLYRATIAQLQRDKFLYPCFESEEELKAKQEFRRKRNQSLIYDRAMLKLTDKQRQDAEAGGKRPHWRFKLSGRTLAWNDLVLGPREATLSTVSDPILVRADGSPTPILASVADDVEYGTTHIIRGEDNAGNTAVQIELFETLRGGRTPIHFGHLPALSDSGKTAPGGRRTGNLALRALRNDGIEPRAIAASMTGLAPVDSVPLPLDELAREFDLTDVATSRFDVTQMLAINRRVLGTMDFASVADRLPSGATETFWLAVRGSLDLLKEARGWWDVVAGTIIPPVVEGARELLLTAGSLLPPEPWDNAVWTRWIATLENATHRTGEALLLPLRLALTGEDSGPDLAHLLPLIGRPRAASRLAIAAT